MPPLTDPPDEQGQTAGAVIGAGAIVLDAAAELRPNKDQSIVLPAVLFQIGVTVGHRAPDVLPQLAVYRQLVAMGVEATVGGVVDLGAQVREHYLAT